MNIMTTCDIFRSLSIGRFFFPTADLAQHLLRGDHQAVPPTGNDASAWLPHCLGAAGVADSRGVDAGFFGQQLEGGRCTVLGERQEITYPRGVGVARLTC